MPKFIIPSSSFRFLENLSKNNNRDWFEANKATYLKQHELMIDFAEDLLAKMNTLDNSDGNIFLKKIKTKLERIINLSLTIDL